MTCAARKSNAALKTNLAFDIQKKSYVAFEFSALRTVLAQHLDFVKVGSNHFLLFNKKPPSFLGVFSFLRDVLNLVASFEILHYVTGIHCIATKNLKTTCVLLASQIVGNLLASN